MAVVSDAWLLSSAHSGRLNSSLRCLYVGLVPIGIADNVE